LKDGAGWDEYLGALEDGAPVPLSTWSDYVKEKWWLRYTNGSSSVGEMVGLSDRDEEAMKMAAERYSLPVAISDTETRVLTIHASKGTEASNVVLYDGLTGSVTDGMEGSDVLRENEARTWYVALTRASDRLHLIRDVFDYTEPYLPEDLEPRAAADAKRMRGEAQ
jgi:DNA helicase-2/ATP-dependent DNA helicase PcrA